jgi:hypothetical protein
VNPHLVPTPAARIYAPFVIMRFSIIATTKHCTVDDMFSRLNVYDSWEAFLEPVQNRASQDFASHTIYINI